MSLKKNILLTWKNPHIAWHKARVTLWHHLRARRDYHFYRGFAGAPQVVAIRLTNLCNLNCLMCGQPRPGDENVPRSFFTDTLNIRELKSVVDDIAPFRPNFYLWGGEPLLYKDIFKLIGYAKEKGLTVQVNTNGLLLEKYAGEIVASGCDDLIVSIDGPGEIHDRIRGMPGAFRQIRKGVDALRAVRRENHTTRPILRIRATIHPENFSSLSQLMQIAQDLNADSLNFNQLWFTSEQAGQAYQNLMHSAFGINACSWKGFVYQPSELNFPDLNREMHKLKNNRTKFPITISPFLSEKEFPKYYQDLSFRCGARTCYSIYFKTYLMPNGDVTPCPDFPDFIAGNIRHEKLLEIWNGARYRAFRRLLKSKKLMPICTRCCDLYVSNVKFY